ncbi:MAG: hypothetical protein WCB18_02680 [Thermoplasmata archaeon]
MSRVHRRHFCTPSSLWLRAGLLGTAGVVVVAVLSAGPALGQSTWNGTGTYTIESTPSSSPCSGQGTAQISLQGSGGSVSGPITISLTSQSAGCDGGLNPGGTAQFTGTLNGNQLSGTDDYGDSWSGTLNGGTLQMTYTSPAASPNCVQWCTQTGTFTFSGSGDLGVLAFGSPASIAGAVAGLLGLGAVVASLGSLRSPRTARSHEGFSWRWENGKWVMTGHVAPAQPVATPPITQYAPVPSPTMAAPGPATIMGAPAAPEAGLSGGSYATPSVPQPSPDPPIGQHESGPSCPVHRSPCIPALERLATGPSMRWFCPAGGHYPWG